MPVVVELPFPPAALSGHANGNGRWQKIALTKQWRAMARRATEAAEQWPLPDAGDIRLHIHFVPPDKRSDRLNFVNRMKAAVDGIADGLGVNDRRFLPSISYAEPLKPGKVVVTIGEME